MGKSIRNCLRYPHRWCAREAFPKFLQTFVLLVAVTGHDIGIAIFFPKTDEEERQAFIESSNGPELFAHVEGESVVLAVMKAPQEGEWRVIVASDGESSFSFHMLHSTKKLFARKRQTLARCLYPLSAVPASWPPRGWAPPYVLRLDWLQYL